MKLIICLAFVLWSSLGIFAQTANDTENRFFEALDKANRQDRFLQSSPYREINTGEISLKFKNEDSVKQLSSYKTVRETDKIGTHAFYELSKNHIQEKYESVTIYRKDDKYFERKDDGDWLRVEKLSKNVGGGLALRTSKDYKEIRKNSATNQTTVDYKYLGNEVINNQIADVYVTVEILPGKNITTQTRKFWFASNGKILKLDLEIIIESNAGFSRSHYMQTWESDENIKIEAPETLTEH